VTTWSCTGLRWSGVRLVDFYRVHVAPRVRQGAEVRYVLLRGQDGYRTLLPLEDALAADILLADMLDGRRLTLEHGAPLRVVAPAHYGYKQVKHLERIEFWEQKPDLKRGMLAFMEHPRGRVAFEERGSYFPGWLLRYLYRPLIAPAVARFAQATAQYKNKEA
jgi:DMSO/TMAO reductase YedYZ molybdopterin-dependent catalytic subunit